MLAIRIPSHHLSIITNMIYDGAYGSFGVSNNLLPFTNVSTGEKLRVYEPGNNVVIEYEDKPYRSTMQFLLPQLPHLID